MAEVTNQGYLDLRSYIKSNWDCVELRKADDTPIVRMDLTDARLTWDSPDGAQELILKVVINGSDADISGKLPVEFAKSVVFKDKTDSTPVSVEVLVDPTSGNPSPFTMTNTVDKLTVRHKIQVPKI